MDASFHAKNKANAFDINAENARLNKYTSEAGNRVSQAISQLPNDAINISVAITQDDAKIEFDRDPNSKTDFPPGQEVKVQERGGKSKEVQPTNTAEPGHSSSEKYGGEDFTEVGGELQSDKSRKEGHDEKGRAVTTKGGRTIVKEPPSTAGGPQSGKVDAQRFPSDEKGSKQNNG